MDGKLLYNDEKDNIIPEVNDRAKKSRKEILKKMGKKRMTKKLKERRLWEAYFQKGKTLLMAHFFNSILPMFKSSYWYSSKTCL